MRHTGTIEAPLGVRATPTHLNHFVCVRLADVVHPHRHLRDATQSMPWLTGEQGGSRPQQAASSERPRWRRPRDHEKIRVCA